MMADASFPLEMIPESSQEGVAAYTEYNDQGGHYPEQRKDNGGFSGACCTMCIGLLVFPLALVVLGWNEQTSVCANNMIMLAEDNAEVGECDNAASVEGKFSFISCPIAVDNATLLTPKVSFNLPGLGDSVSFASIAGAQRVEMYQCIESKASTTKSSVDADKAGESVLQRTGVRTRTSESALQKEQERRESAQEQADHGKSDLVRRGREGKGSKTTYQYRMEWSDVHYKSQEYKETPEFIVNSGCPDFIYRGIVNHNPSPPDRGDGSPVEIGRQKVTATSVVAGGYTLSEEKELHQLTAEESVSMKPFADQFSLSGGVDQIINSINTNTVGVHEETPHFLSSCRSDKLGCIRISYSKSDATHMSVLALTEGAGILKPQPVDSSWGCAATSFIRMFPEEMSKDDMIARLKDEQHATTWGFRIAGLIAAMCGLYCCFQPVAHAADVMGDVLSYIPIIGQLMENVLEGVVDMALLIISCSFGLSCGLLVIAIVWLAMRPVVGGPLLLGVLVLMAIGYYAASTAKRDPRRMRKDKQAFAQQQPWQQQGEQQPWQQQGDHGYGEQ